MELYIDTEILLAKICYNKNRKGQCEMKQYDVVVIGGSAAGATAAITARRHYPDKSILLIRKESQVPIPCGIPYVIGTVGDAKKNLIPVDTMMAGNKIDATVDEVTAIDRDSCTLSLLSGESVSYDRLILSTGSSPIIPRLPGTDLDNVFAIRKDVPYLTDMIDKICVAKDICIIGCGFIGVEIAEECRIKCPNANITIVEMLNHCLQLVYDEEFCVLADEKLTDQNVSLMLNEKVEALAGNGTVDTVKLKSGNTIKADLVIMGIGTSAQVALAKQAGLELGPIRGIKVNRRMQTADDKIFACGDCAEKVSFFDGEPSPLKLASIATMEARIAGANLFEPKRMNSGVIGAFSTVIGGTAFAAAGLTETQARNKGLSVVCGMSESVNRHPGCMPGGAKLKVKLIFDAKTSILIGGQITGALSGGELINVISMCILHKMTADDMAIMQVSTHPALTASPIAYQLVNAAEAAIAKKGK